LTFDNCEHYIVIDLRKEMKFSSINIPDYVENNIVYKGGNGPDLVVERGEIRQGNEYLTPKETHSFIKEVVSNNKVHVFQALLNNGISLHLGDLIYLACQRGSRDMVTSIMNTNHVDPNRVTKYGWTAVEIAAINGHIDIVKILVNQYNAKKNFENPNNGSTPLENAIEGGHLETVKQMIKDLGCEYGHMAWKVKDLASAASLVITQGELLRPGHEHDLILRFLQEHHEKRGEMLPITIESRLTKRLVRATSITRTETVYEYE